MCRRNVQGSKTKSSLFLRSDSKVILMEANASNPTFDEARREWVTYVAEKITGTGSRLDDLLPERGVVERALLITHVGTGFNFGAQECDLEIDGFLSVEEAASIVSDYWLSGRLAGELSCYLPFLWSGLFQVGQDLELVSRDLLEGIRKSNVWTAQEPWLGSMPCSVTDRLAALSRIGAVWEQERITKEAAPVSPLDCDGSHLEVVSTLATADPKLARFAFSALEILASFPQSEKEIAAGESLTETYRSRHIYRVVPSGRPGPLPRDVPPWVRDLVVDRGIRTFRYLTGSVAGFFVITESHEDARAVRQWEYEPNLGVSLDEERVLKIVAPLVYESDESTGTLQWVYDLKHADSALELRAMLALQMVRVDFYVLASSGELEYSHGFGIHIPHELNSKILDLISCFPFSFDQVALFEDYSDQNWLEAMGLSELSLFESLMASTDSLAVDRSSPLSSAFLSYLETISISLSQERAQLDGKRDLFEAREHWRAELSRTPRVQPVAIDLEPLGDQRAYVQFLLSADGGNRIFANYAYAGDDGLVLDHTIECEGDIDLDGNLEQQVLDLVTGFKSMAVTLLRLGAVGAVIAPAAALYNLPFHESLIRLGFSQVTFCPRVALLRPKTEPEAGGVLISGYEGSGADLIEGVDVEIKILEEIYGVRRTVGLPHYLPSIVHLAGHGSAGRWPQDVWIDIEGGATPLSSAKVIRDFNAAGTKVVFLSACSTGRGEYGISVVPQTIPLDLAFLLIGAEVVISTSALVQDDIALVVAVVFHKALNDGVDLWEAFLCARECARSGVVPSAYRALFGRGQAVRNLKRAVSVYPDEWLKYRVSGRVWE